ncbi:MAG TPA: glycosyltransferase, partial [Mariprofundaceae bacterium]|nr:glycosyltransferase [Mariprofundaceae bacterium]
ESEMSADEFHRVEEGLNAFQVVGGVVQWLPSLKRSLGLHDWMAYREIAALLNDRFDLVHTHTSKAGVLGRLAVSGRAKIVHTPHGHIFHGYFGSLKTKLFVAVERWMAKKSDALIALTEAEKQDHLKLNIGKAQQWHVIPSGVDVEAISRDVVRLQQQPDHQIKWDAVSVGRLVSVKGMDRLIRAWAEVCKTIPEARLAIVGDGEARKTLQAQAEVFGLAENIHFAGWADPIPYLASARCFVLLSRNEGMGRAVVEAFAASLPCVVSDVCGLSELVDESVGAVVDAEKSGQVAQSLLLKWSPSVAASARARADHYSVEAMINGLESIYESVTKR